ncbi:MAG: 50S ribosomal protein L11 methyltransferase [Burkholderiaceae bacterium]
MVELLLLAPRDRVERVSDALMDELGALSVSVEDADAGTSAEDALFGEPGMPAPRQGWQRSTITALFIEDSVATEALALLLAQDFADDVRLLALQAVPDTDWVRLTQSQFTPVEIAPGFWIVPSWHEPPAEARTMMRLDPGLAFGTGTHPTTRMCLAWAARASASKRAWGRVLDYGCGSGILAIGVGLFGAADIDAVDIDPAAVQATIDNAQRNGVTLLAGLPDAVHGAYDTVFANILATPLKLLAPLLCGHVAAGGSLVLAGILARQADELKAAYAPWLAIEVEDAIDGWVLMTARRAATPGAPGSHANTRGNIAP